MFKRIRYSLCFFILGRRLNNIAEFGATCLHRAMQRSGNEYMDWQMTDGQFYVLTTGTGRRTRLHEPDDAGLVCDVCKCYFDGDFDRAARCPNCRSTSVSLA